MKYVAVVFANGPSYGLSDTVRLCAGHFLRSIIKNLYILQSQDDKAYIRQNVLNCLIDPSLSIRHAAGSIISSILTVITLDTWPELLSALFSMMKSEDYNYLESCMNCLSSITEDCALQLDSNKVGRPLNDLVPQFILLLHHSSDVIRLLATKCLRNIIDIEPQALTIRLNDYLQVYNSSIHKYE